MGSQKVRLAMEVEEVSRPYTQDEVTDLLGWAHSFPEEARAKDILKWGATVKHWQHNHADAVEKKRRGEEVKQGIINEVQRENDALRTELASTKARLVLLEKLEEDARRLHVQTVDTAHLTSWVYEAKGFIKRLALAFRGIDSDV